MAEFDSMMSNLKLVQNGNVADESTVPDGFTLVDAKVPCPDKFSPGTINLGFQLESLLGHGAFIVSESKDEIQGRMSGGNIFSVKKNENAFTLTITNRESGVTSSKVFDGISQKKAYSLISRAHLGIDEIQKQFNIQLHEHTLTIDNDGLVNGELSSGLQIHAHVNKNSLQFPPALPGLSSSAPNWTLLITMEDGQEIAVKQLMGRPVTKEAMLDYLSLLERQNNGKIGI